MEPAVRELVHPVQRQAVERDELAHAREMEEPVAPDLTCDVPEEQSHDGSRDSNDGPARRPLLPAAARERQH